MQSSKIDRIKDLVEQLNAASGKLLRQGSGDHEQLRIRQAL